MGNVWLITRNKPSTWRDLSVAVATRLNAPALPMLQARAMYRSTGLSDWTTTHCCCCCAPTAACKQVM